MPETRQAQGIILFLRNHYLYPQKPKGAKDRPPPTKTVNLVIMPHDRHLPQLLQKPRILNLPAAAEPDLYRYISATLFRQHSPGPYWLRETRIIMPAVPATAPIRLETVRYVPLPARQPLTNYREWLKSRLETLWPALRRLEWNRPT